jgi:hypothetical protein
VEEEEENKSVASAAADISDSFQQSTASHSSNDNHTSGSVEGDCLSPVASLSPSHVSSFSSTHDSVSAAHADDNSSLFSAFTPPTLASLAFTARQAIAASPRHTQSPWIEITAAAAVRSGGKNTLNMPDLHASDENVRMIRRNCRLINPPILSPSVEGELIHSRSDDTRSSAILPPQEQSSAASSAGVASVTTLPSLLSKGNISTFKRKGWLVFRGSAIPAFRSLAETLLALHNNHPDSGHVIGGGTCQYSVSNQRRFADALTEWRTLLLCLVSDLAVACGLGDDRRSYRVSHESILYSMFRHGRQEIHWDRMRELVSKLRFSALFFLTSHRSTALPIFSYNERLSVSSDAAEMRSLSRFLQPSNFVSFDVAPGDVILFHQGVPHFGVENHLKNTTRTLLFSIVAPSDEPADDDLQVYRWSFIRYAFGEGSKEYARALVDAQRYMDVIEHMQTREEREAAQLVLDMFHLTLGESMGHISETIVESTSDSSSSTLSNQYFLAQTK